jgi:hypothetical protein
MTMILGTNKRLKRIPLAYLDNGVMMGKIILKNL